MLKYQLLGLGVGVMMFGSSMDVILTNANHGVAQSISKGQSQRLLAYWDTQLQRDTALISYTKNVIKSEQTQLHQTTAAISELNTELKKLQSFSGQSKSGVHVIPAAATVTVSIPPVTVSPPSAMVSAPAVQTVTSASGG